MRCVDFNDHIKAKYGISAKKKFGDSWQDELEQDCFGEMWVREDGMAGILVWTCDRCGNSFIEYGPECFLYSEIGSHQEFLKRHYAEAKDFKTYCRDRGFDWRSYGNVDMELDLDALKERITESYGFELDEHGLEDSVFLSDAPFMVAR